MATTRADVVSDAGDTPTLDELRAEARYHRDRYALYRARALTGKPTTQTRMRELERAAAAALERLERATSRRSAP